VLNRKIVPVSSKKSSLGYVLSDDHIGDVGGVEYTSELDSVSDTVTTLSKMIHIFQCYTELILHYDS
jgi:hypothetical protein